MLNHKNGSNMIVHTPSSLVQNETIRKRVLPSLVQCARTLLALCFLSLLFCTALPAPAQADLKLCNTTPSRVGVAIGYREKNRWASEGWWNIASNTCEVLLTGKLIARYYYLHVIDYDRGGEWSGKDTMCTTDKAFTIYGVKDCLKRDYKRTGFFEVDTKNRHDWTVRIVDPDENGKK